MTHRKEVFQSKVLQKLYPEATKLEKEASSPCMLVDTLVNKKHVKRKPPHQDIPHSLSPRTIIQSKRMYTVLPPPEDYDAHSVTYVTPNQLDGINCGDSPSEHGIQQCEEELDHDVEINEQKRRRKRRKKRLNLQGQKDEKAPTIESTIVQNETLMDGVHISRNKKRKLKKKRHKEKMLSLGLMPRASALEFTYQKETSGEEDGMRAAQLAEFLRTTMEVYKSDALVHTEKLPHLSAMLENLVSSITSGSRPSSLLKHLHTLQLCIQGKDTDRLEKALQELRSNTLMAAEATAVAGLFQYWITDIFPMK
ncbi:glutamate-rich protein 1 isoform X2 [Corythoichthys intestinalis]|uniref:glutamate-rich protein 1 isoform X2 n=1 Tax=Corythoichthys intestinalis TaxID=161448 RepID=UPI0025A4D3C4|nr:glutamate-rich protein 1 isoform X2 [Corythoichthys intestinalis]